MAIQNEPTRISTPFADAGTKNVIPETMAQPSATAAASWQAGFPTVCSLPLSAGGIPPARNDFNGLFNQLSQTSRFLQDGGIFAWNATTDYGANRLVLGSDGKLYWSAAQSGPNTGAGAVDPTTDSGAYWGQLPVTATEAAEAAYSSVAGGFVPWSSAENYAVSQIVLGSDGLVYMAKATSGPGTAAGAKDPTNDSSHTYWISPTIPTMPIADSSKSCVNSEWVNLWLSNQQASFTYYVDPVNGDDLNDGLTVTTPKKTVFGTLSTIIGKPIPKIGVITLNLVDANYNEAISVSTSGITILLQGPSSGYAQFTGLSMAMAGVNVQLGRNISFSGPINVGRGSALTLNYNCKLRFSDLGVVAYSISAYSNGIVSMYANSPVSIEYTGTNSFSTGCIYATDGGRFAFTSALTVTNSGTVSGQRYSCTHGSGISGTGSVTKFPGSTNGSVDTTSYYS